MHGLSLGMPEPLEPMLSLSMLILATCPEAAFDVTIETKIKIDILKFQHVDFGLLWWTWAEFCHVWTNFGSDPAQV